MNNTSQWIQDLTILKSQIEQRQNLIQEVLRIMGLDLTALTQQVAATATVEASAVTLINAIIAELMANANDPAAVTALANQLKAATDPLATAIAVANTP